MKNINIVVTSLPAPYLQVDYLVREPKWEMSLHSHDFFQVILLESGILELKNDNHFCQITRGQLCIIPPGTPHHFFTEQGCVQMGVDFSVENSSHPLESLLSSKVKEISIVNHPEMLSYIADMRVEMNKLTSFAKLKIVNMVRLSKGNKNGVRISFRRY
jgi:hypothetical protein